MNIKSEDFPPYIISAIADKLGYNEGPEYLGPRSSIFS
jgi:hypothetical protein